MGELSAEDKVKERIKFSIERLRLCVIGLISVVGGIVSLINNDRITGKTIFFIAAGLVLTVGLIAYTYKFYNSIKQQIT